MENNDWSDKAAKWIIKNIFRYVFAIIFTFIEIGIVLAIFDNYSYSDIAPVLAGIGILYAVVRSMALGLESKINNLAIAFANDVGKIRMSLVNSHEDEKEDFEAIIKKANEDVFKNNIKLAIRSIGIFIIFIVCLINLFN